MAGNVYRYLNALVTEGSFSRAARVLQISQPSISQFLHRIEQEVGAKLIDRSAKPLRFTYAGECFMKTENEIEQLRQKRARLIADIGDDVLASEGADRDRKICRLYGLDETEYIISRYYDIA